MIFVESLLIAASVVLLVPTTVLLCEVICGVGASDGGQRSSGKRPRLAILVPAHNEAASLATTLRHIRRQTEPSDRLLVVADNCTDDTALIAAAEGAEVIERHHLLQRGKGFALDFGIRHLAGQPPEVVVIVDADCELGEQSLHHLATLCFRSGRPVQAMYLMRGSATAGLKARVAEFAWIVKNRVRPLGLRRLGLPCQLMGTGMAFPWECIRTANLATGHIVEDLKLGIDLARRGEPPLFCPEAIVTSVFPETAAGVTGQRTRWEHGHLSIIFREAPRVLLEAIRTANKDLLAVGLDIIVPPLALLSLGATVVWLLSGFSTLHDGHMLPFFFATATSTLLGAAVLLAWAQHGRTVLSLGSLVFAIPYALWKLPLYIRFVLARQVSWVRADRERIDRPK